MMCELFKYEYARANRIRFDSIQIWISMIWIWFLLIRIQIIKIFQI